MIYARVSSQTIWKIVTGRHKKEVIKNRYSEIEKRALKMGVVIDNLTYSKL